MKARHIKRLRSEIHHYRMYGLYHYSGPTDILECELNKYPYKLIYGRSAINAIVRFCNKRPDYRYHIDWISLSKSAYPDLMILEEGKSYRHRFYFTW